VTQWVESQSVPVAQVAPLDAPTGLVLSEALGAGVLPSGGVSVPPPSGLVADGAGGFPLSVLVEALGLALPLPLAVLTLLAPLTVLAAGLELPLAPGLLGLLLVAVLPVEFDVLGCNPVLLKAAVLELAAATPASVVEPYSRSTLHEMRTSPSDQIRPCMLPLIPPNAHVTIKNVAESTVAECLTLERACARLVLSQKSSCRGLSREIFTERCAAMILIGSPRSVPEVESEARQYGRQSRFS
jgi:hypothetical protein